MAGPYHLPKRILHTEPSSVSSFSFECPLFPIRSSSSFLRLLPCLPLAYILPSTFPSVTFIKRQFLSKV